MTLETASARTPSERVLRFVGRAALGCLIAVFVLDLWVALAHPHMTGDTSGLVIGSRRVVDCLREHRFTHCETAQEGGFVGLWPLMQYLPAVALRAVGLSHDSALRVIIALNAIALGALGTLVWVVAKRKADAVWAPVLAAALVASPLLWYGTAAFGEALAGAVIIAAVAAALLRARPSVVASLVVLACITKETNPPFVLALVALATVAVAETRDEKRRRLILIAVAAVGGAAANAGFNVFRYGSIRNPSLLHPYEQAPNRAAVRAFAALWVAPNGGILWFWPVAVAILALAVAASIRHTGRSWSWRRWAAPIVAGLLVVEVAGLSKWYSPFGWIAWGPRLLLPLMPSMLLVVAVLGTADATRFLRRFLTGRWFWPGAVATVLVGLPQAMVMYYPHTLAKFFGDPRCRNAHVGSNPTRYYRCFDYLAWSKRPLLLQDGLEGLNSAGGRIFAVAFGAAILSLLYLARLLARTGGSPEPGAELEPPGPADARATTSNPATSNPV